MKDLFEEEKFPSLTECIWISLICTGPIGMLIIRIVEEKWAALPLNAVLALVSVIVIIVVWKEYYTARKKYKSEMKEKNKRQVKIWPFLIFTLILAVLLIVVCTVQAEKILSPDKWLFYEMQGFAEICMILVTVIGSLIIVYCIYEILTNNEKIKYIIGIVITCIVIFIGSYCALIHVTYVTDEKLIVHTLFQPNGVEYGYDEIRMVEAGFGKKRIALFEKNRRGVFTYKIYLEDRRIEFSAPSVNESIERYMEDTYLELEEFDDKLMDMGVSKEANSQYSEYCELDKEYVDRFIRIIENTK